LLRSRQSLKLRVCYMEKQRLWWFSGHYDFFAKEQFSLLENITLS
jgi:hypothetical protein